MSILLNDPKTTFKTAIISASEHLNAFVQTLALADFNGDGKADLVTTNFSGVPSSTSVGVFTPAMATGRFKCRRSTT